MGTHGRAKKKPLLNDTRKDGKSQVRTFDTVVCPLCGKETREEIFKQSIHRSDEWDDVCMDCYDSLRENFSEILEILLDTYSYDETELKILKFMAIDSRDLMDDIEKAFDNAIENKRTLREVERITEDHAYEQRANI